MILDNIKSPETKKIQETIEVSKKDTMEYVNHQKKPRKIIANLTSEITLFDGSGLKQLKYQFIIFMVLR